MKRSLVILAATWLAALSVAPVHAKKAPPDPGAQVCELDWQASFGKIELKQTWSGAGELNYESLSIRREFPANMSSYLLYFQSRYGRAGYASTSRQTYLSFSGTMGKEKSRQLIVTMPDGAPMIIDLDDQISLVSISDAQLTRLIEAKQRLTYRVVKVDRNGAEKKLLGTGWFDLSGFADQPLAGLPEIRDRARTAMAQARAGGNPPCAKTSAAEMNAMDSDDAVRKWLSFGCGEGWSGPLGSFELREDRFSWRPRPRDGVTISFVSSSRGMFPSVSQHFLTGPDESSRYGQIRLDFDMQRWGVSKPATDKSVFQQLTVELRRGPYVVRKAFTQSGSIYLNWDEYAQLVLGTGDLQIGMRDAINGSSVESSLPWSEILAAEEELRTGHARLRERERDPMTRCKALVDAEYGGEQIIVT